MLNFKSFNELKSHTYIDAGRKLKQKGHSKRGEDLIMHGKEKDDYKKDIIKYYHLKDIDNIDIKSVNINDINEYLALKPGNTDSIMNIEDKINNKLILSLKIDHTHSQGNLKDVIETHIIDRKSALKMYKYLKDKYGKRLYITVNDIYNPDQFKYLKNKYGFQKFKNTSTSTGWPI